MTLNGSGIRDITRVLRVSLNTVLKVLRAEAARTPGPHPPPRVADVEVDEMWSFVGKNPLNGGGPFLLRPLSADGE